MKASERMKDVEAEQKKDRAAEAKKLMDREEEILHLYNFGTSIPIGSFEGRPVYVYRMGRSELDELRAKDDDEFIKEVEDVYGWLAMFYQGMMSVSVADCEWRALVDCEMERRSVLSPELAKRLGDIMVKINKAVEDAIAAGPVLARAPTV